MKKIVYSIACALCVLVSACKPTGSTNAIPEGQYAKGFVIIPHDGATEVVIYSPWEEGKELSRFMVEDGQPLCRLATTSATHAGFLHALEADDHIAGYCDPALVYNIREGAADLGSALALDAERILAADADAVLLSTYQANDKNAELLAKVGIRYIPVNEWTEEHPLARAEWIRLIGVLIGKQQEADSIFEEVKASYLQLAANTPAEHPSIVSGSTWQGTWYVPSGRTYMGQLFRDAGASYAYDSDTTAGSLPLSFEQALLAFKDADVWVGVSVRTLEELRGMNEKHSWFKAYETGRIYNFNKRTTPLGGNDFWETGVVRPDLLLKDLQTILRNEPDSLLYFSEKLL